MSTVCIIPARGGSVRIPRKNIREFHGRPIIAYSIETARQCGLFDGGVYVSTEDAEISEVAKHYGALVIDRPPELAEIGAADCGTQEVTRHALIELGITEGYACCLYPCAPLVTAQDLEDASRVIVDNSPFNYVYAKGVFYFGLAIRFINQPNDFSHSLRISGPRQIDIDIPEDWTRAEATYAEWHP